MDLSYLKRPCLQQILYFDFTGIQTVNFILPQGQTFIQETSQGFPWDQAIKDVTTTEGSI